MICREKDKNVEIAQRMVIVTVQLASGEPFASTKRFGYALYGLINAYMHAVWETALSQLISLSCRNKLFLQGEGDWE